MSETRPVNDRYVWSVQGGAGVVSFPTCEAADAAIQTLLEKGLVSYDERKELSEWDKQHGTLEKIAEARRNGEKVDVAPSYRTVKYIPAAKEHIAEDGSVSFRIDVAKDKFEAAKVALDGTGATFIEAWPKHQELVFETREGAEVVAAHLATTGALPEAKAETRTRHIQGIPAREGTPGSEGYEEHYPVIEVPLANVDAVSAQLKTYEERTQQR